MKPSKEQQRVLDLMQAGEWYSAYDLSCSLATLRALTKKGLARMKGQDELGALWSPRTTYKYQKNQ